MAFQKFKFFINHCRLQQQATFSSSIGNQRRQKFWLKIGQKRGNDASWRSILWTFLKNRTLIDFFPRSGECNQLNTEFNCFNSYWNICIFSCFEAVLYFKSVVITNITLFSAATVGIYKSLTVTSVTSSMRISRITGPWLRIPIYGRMAYINWLSKLFTSTYIIIYIKIHEFLLNT